MEENNSYPDINPAFKSFSHLIILIGLYVTFAVLAVYAGVQITSLVLGVNVQLDLEQISFESLTSYEIFGYKLSQLIASTGTFVVTALVFAKFFARQKLSTYFGFVNIVPQAKIFVLTLIIALSAIPTLSLIISINEQIPLPSDIAEAADAMQVKYGAFYSILLDAPSVWVLLFNLLVVALVPAVGEELLFRGAFMQIFYRLFKERIHLSIIVVAVLFSVMHLQYYNFLGIILMGVVYGYLYYWSGNIMVSIWAHFINNGTIVLFSYLVQNNMGAEFMKQEYKFSPVISLISGAIMVGAIYLFYKTTRQFHATQELEAPTEED